MFRLLIIFTALVISTVSADDCLNNLKCGKCVNQSEFAWHPADTFVSKDLSYFYQLPELIEKEYQQGNLNETGKYAQEYLNLASSYRCNWNHGNAIHDANRYLGLISLKRNNPDKAAIYLVQASQTQGSMQLESFGPDLDLANQLLKEGKRDEVLQYLKRMDEIWKNNQSVHTWISKIEAGKKPVLQRYSQALSQQHNALSLSY